MKYLFNDIKSKDKINKIIKIYNEISLENLNKTNSILLLVPNTSTKILYQNAIELNESEEIKVTTYKSFIKKELIKYWSIVSQKCEYIKSKDLTPTFISNTISEFIIGDKVSQKRNLDGYFIDITSSTRNITNNIKNNINKGLEAMMDFEVIGEKIYLSKKNKDNIMQFSYSQMNEIINYYVEKLLNNSMLDDALSIYVYNRYLINDEFYLKKLQSNIDYIIVESLESCTTAEVDFIDLVSNTCKESYLYYDKSKDYSVFNNIDIEYIENKFKDLLAKKENVRMEDIYLLNNDIELNENNQLYNEMIENASYKVIELIDDGIKAKDIVIILPINNSILDYQVKNILNKKNIEVFNTKKDMKLIEYPYMSAMVVAVCLFCDALNLIKEEEHINFIEVLLNVNRIKAIKISKKKIENEQYNQLINYIEKCKIEKMKINEFLTKFYIDKMLNLKLGQENVKLCKSLIQESENFILNINKLGIVKNEEYSFIETLKNIIKDFSSARDIDSKKFDDCVMITSPYSYISNNINRKIHIWMDISSNSWNMKIEKDISNLIVLRKTYEEKKQYTDFMEESYKKYYLYNMLYQLLLDAKKVYAYKSEYSINGYIQESILYGALLKLIDGNEVNNG